MYINKIFQKFHVVAKPLQNNKINTEQTHMFYSLCILYAHAVLKMLITKRNKKKIWLKFKFWIIEMNTHKSVGPVDNLKRVT